jgi:uncharacterized protein
MRDIVGRKGPWRTRLASTSLSILFLLGACGGNDGPTPAEQDAAARPQAAAFAGYTRADTHGAAVEPNLLVPMRDGFRLTCDLHRPARTDGSPAEGKFPSLLVNFTAYGRMTPGAGNDLRDFAKKGYAVLWCNARGSQGISGSSPSLPESRAPANPFSPKEAQDGYDTVEWIASQSWSTGKVGQIGTSYGAIMSLLVAGLAPPHLTASIPILGTHDQYRDFAYPGGIKTSGDARGQFAALCSTLTGEDTCAPRMKDEWDAHPTFDSYWQPRAVDLNAIKAATLFVVGAKDFWTASNDKRLAVIGGRDNVATVFGPWDHTTPELKNPELKNMYLAWFDRWVADMPSAAKPPKAVVQGLQSAGTAAWDGFAAWPPRSSETQTFFLSSTSLQVDPPTSGNLKFVIAADGTSPGLTLATAAFSKAVTLAGPVEVNLPLSFSASDANIIVNVASRGSDGTLTDLGYAAYQKASHAESDASPVPRITGKTYLFKMNVPSKYWQFRAGESLVLTITSADDIVVKDSPPGSVSIALGQEAFIRAPMLLH